MAHAQECLSGLDAAIALLDRAAVASLSTPGRTGFLLDLPAQGDILISGDLHGNCGNLQRLIEIANLQRHRQRHLVISELVHEVNGGEACRSHRLVELAARLKEVFPNQVHYLLGNHEFSEVLSLDIGKNGRYLNNEFAEGLRQTYAARWEEALEAYRRFWRTCPLAIHTGRLFIAHSTPRLSKLDDLSLDYLRGLTVDRVFQRHGPVFALLWGRDYRPEAADAVAARMEADVLIVGHTPCETGFQTPNSRHVILDTTTFEGCYCLLPLDRPLTQPEVVARIRRLYNPAGV